MDLLPLQLLNQISKHRSHTLAQHMAINGTYHVDDITDTGNHTFVLCQSMKSWMTGYTHILTIHGHPNSLRNKHCTHMNETLHSQTNSAKFPEHIGFNIHYVTTAIQPHHSQTLSLQDLNIWRAITELCSASGSLGLAGACTPAIRACIGLSWSPTAGWTDGDMLPHCWR